MTWRNAASALVSLALCGCVESLESAAAKFNRAFPVSAEARVAEERLRDLLAEDADGLRKLEADYGARLELRALTCSQGLDIGRLDSVARIKALAVDGHCLGRQDVELRTFLALRTIGVLVSQPPLRPLVPLGPAVVVEVPEGEGVFAGNAASAAGVGMLWGTRGEVFSVEVPGGRKIAELSRTSYYSPSSSIAPNGRVAAIQVDNRFVSFFDLQTGAELWKPDGVQRLLAWMPALSMALAAGSDKGALLLLDFQSGKIREHAVVRAQQTWGLAMPDPARALAGSGSDFALIEHQRTPSGVDGSVVKDFRFAAGQGVTSLPPTLMLDGRAIVFVSQRDLAMFNLETGEQTHWPGDGVLANRYAKLSEQTLRVETYAASGVATKSWVLDVTRSTLAPIEEDPARSGLLYELVGRRGFLLRGFRQVWFGDEVRAGAPVPFEQVRGSINLERQLARMESMDGRSAPAKESAPPVATGAFATLARDAEIHAIGVYEGRGASHGPGKPRHAGAVSVTVRASAKPIVLVLSSYEPVVWALRISSGARVVGVLLSGYHESKVVGADSVRQARIGAAYCYEGARCSALEAEVQSWINKRITSFQGAYEGGAFVIGGV